MDALKGIRWDDIETAADLACGTGRTGVWLSQHGVRFIDGLDVTPEMLQILESKGVYRHLQRADVQPQICLFRVMIFARSFLADERLANLN